MDLQITKTDEKDLYKIIQVRNLSFQRDFQTFGSCPGYNLSFEEIKEKFNRMEFYSIIVNNEIVGNLSFREDSENVYYIGCMCIIPKFENMGIGTNALKFIETLLPAGSKVWLITPTAKKKNLYFYAKNGYVEVEELIDDNVKVTKFEKQL